MKLITKESLSSEAMAQKAYANLIKREDLGFLRLPKNNELPKQAKAWSDSLQTKGQKQLFVVGLGGSFLGAKALIKSLLTTSCVRFLFSLDKILLEEQLQNTDLNSCHFLLISKSGSTLETLSIANYILTLLEEKNLPFSRHISVITEEKPSPLFDFATKHLLTIIPHPKDVGGRFSVFSSVGVYPCTFANLPFNNIFNGAKKAFDSSFSINCSAYFYEQLKDQKKISVFWPYNDRLYDFGLWLVQLWGESLTKKNRRDGSSTNSNSTPTLCIGTRDQHSLLQNFVQGNKNHHIVFFKELISSQTISKNYFQSIPALNHSLEKQLAASQKGTLQSLQEAGVEAAMIEHEQLSPQLMGEMMMSFELIIGILGEMLDINAYDQPGVERAKQICLQLLN